MISMHCPSCGAEGRIPKEKVNTRLLCKKCLKSFHLTSDGKVLPGPPPHDEDEEVVHHETPGHEFDHVDEEIDLVMKKIRQALPKVGVGLALLLAAFLAWPFIRGNRPVGLDAQTKAVARALAHNDPAALEELSVDPAAAAELAEAVQPEFAGHANIVTSTSPIVEVSRKHESPGPGLAEVMASIKPEERRTGISVRDASAELPMAGAVEIPMILTGDDGSGWKLDAGRTLEAYRKMRAPAESAAPSTARNDAGKGSKAAATARGGSPAPVAPPASTARPAGAPRA